MRLDVIRTTNVHHKQHLKFGFFLDIQSDMAYSSGELRTLFG